MVSSGILALRISRPLRLTLHPPWKAFISTRASNAVYAKFLREYNLERYTFDSKNSSIEEFKRLAEAQQWGPSLVAKYQASLDRAVRVAEFFEKYEGGGYRYDPTAEDEVEFSRLCEERGWDGEVLGRVRVGFDEASRAPAESRRASGARDGQSPPKAPRQEMHTPIAKFLISQECPGYTYSHQYPELEFRALVTVKKSAWESQQWIWGGGGTYENQDEYRKLRRGFNAAVEELFNLLLSMRKGSAAEEEIRPWEILVELFRLGKAPMTADRARELLKTIYVNIFDFIEFLQERPEGSYTDAVQKLSDTDSHRAQQLRFPNIGLLGAYSNMTSRVYKLNDAVESGTLILLLQRLRPHLDSNEYVLYTHETEPPKVRAYIRASFPREWRNLEREIAEQEAAWNQS